MYHVHEEFEPASSWFPATPEEIACAEAVRAEKEMSCVRLSLSELPKAFWGFLDPNKGLGGIPDPKYTVVLEEQFPGQNDQLASA